MTSQRRLGLIFVLVGPPGVGKNTLMNTVLRQVDNLKQLPTATTRPRRPSEQHGREHLFINRAEFQTMIDEESLIEYQEVHGELYGMPKAAIDDAIAQEHDLIADIDVLGATQLRSIYPDNSVLIFIQPASLDDLKRRMQTRGETEAEIGKRMQRVAMEMQYAPLCDYLITNDDDLEKASNTLYAIILGERSQRALLNLRVERNLPRRKFTYISRVVPVCGEEILWHSEAPHFPTAQLTRGEFPQDAATRALYQELNLDVVPAHLYRSSYEPPDSDFIKPVTIENQIKEHHQQLVFEYLYHLDTRLDPPQDWQWIPYRKIDLPDDILSAIENYLRKTPAATGVESSHEPV